MGHEGDALGFYASELEAVVALMHQSAKRLGTSLSCPEPAASLKRRRVDITDSIMAEPTASRDESSCIVVSIELNIAQLQPVGALLVAS